MTSIDSAQTSITLGSLDQDINSQIFGIESNIVDWNGSEDPENPLNWSKCRKWVTIGLVSTITCMNSLGSTIFAPSVPSLMNEFNSSNGELSGLVVSVFIIGFCFGPLVLAPMSELYGRNVVYHGSNICFTIFSIACAVSTNLPMLIVFRFFMGLSGCPSLSLGGGTIADLIPLNKRGRALSIWAMGPLLGPVIGPIAGGFMAEDVGWRWIFWLIAITTGSIAIVCFFFLHETYAPVLLSRKAARLRRETGNGDLRSKYDKGQTPAHLFKTAIIRPTKMLILSPIVAILALEMSIVYSYSYFLFTTFTYVFERQYGFQPGAVGLVYIGIGVGYFVGQFAAVMGCNKFVEKKSATLSEGEAVKPEWHLPPLVVGAFLIPIGMFWYGWTAEYRIHWIVPIIGTAFVGAGTSCHFFSIQLYLIDTFNIYAASAISTNIVVRSVFATTLPLTGHKMYDSLGLGWGNSVLAFIALALSPAPFFLLKYGERIRTSPKFQLDL